MKALLGIAVTILVVLSEAGAKAEGKKPTIRVEQEEKGDRVFTMVRIAVPTIPDFECDVWCYEDALGQGEGTPQPDGRMVVKHKHPKEYREDFGNLEP